MKLTSGIMNGFIGDFAKFYNWNETLLIELGDELNIDELKILKSQYDTHSHPRNFFAECLKGNYKELFDFLEKYQGCCSIPESKRNIKIIYAAIIMCQATQTLYECALEGIQSSSEFKEFHTPSGGNAEIARYAFSLLFIEPDKIDYWPFSQIS